MKKLTKIFVILFAITSCALLTQYSVFAANTQLGPITGIGPWQIIPADVGVAFSKLASVILGFLTALGGLASFLYLVMGALSWITSGGDKAGLEKARNQITNAMIGLVIIIAAWAITYLIGGVLGLDIVNPQNLIKQLNPNYKQSQPSNYLPDELIKKREECRKNGFGFDVQNQICSERLL